ncbi:MAG TPA: hypothetical protein VF867_11225 [Arthrobacter sp.]
MPASIDKADCICAVLKGCAADTPCPYCRTLEVVHLPCPQLGFSCGIFANDCDCCTAWQRNNAREGRKK